MGQFGSITIWFDNHDLELNSNIEWFHFPIRFGCE